MSISKKEKILLNHLVKVWRAPFVSNTHKDQYYSEAEDYLREHYEDWLKYIYNSEEFDKLIAEEL